MVIVIGFYFWEFDDYGLWILMFVSGFLVFAGGVTSMAPFLKKFFPSVYKKAALDKSTNQYCKFDSETLTLFTSSLYLAALVASLVASTVTRKFGRKYSMLFGGLLFCAGAIINGAAKGVWMLILGRILLGFGIGFANQVKNLPPYSVMFVLFGSREVW